MLSKQRQEELSDLAEFIANEYCPNNLIEPKIIAKKNNISYCYGKYENAFDGLLEHEFGDFHIYLNLDRLKHAHTPRTRFTFAHELGHYFIDEHRNSLLNGHTPSHPSFTDFSSKNPIELEADFFAASLLLPKNRLLQDCFRRKFEFVLIEELSQKYQTSITATLLKFASIGNHPIMIVCLINNAVKWYKCSHDFPFKWLRKPLSKDTIAGEYFYDKTKYNEEIEVTANDWFENVWDNDVDRPFFEKCIYSDQHNFVLSILWEL